MLKTLIVGATLGVIGKMLYDNGRFDAYIATAKVKVDDLLPPADAATQIPKSTH